MQDGLETAGGLDRSQYKPWSPWRARWDSRGHPPSNPRRPPASPPTA